MELIFAWPNEPVDRSPGNRIDASSHPGKSAACMQCGGEVTSVRINGVWQWVHTYRCHKLRR